MTNEPNLAPKAVQASLPTATEFKLFLEESERLAAEAGIGDAELREMDAINQMRIVAESIATDDYIFHTTS